MLVRRELHDQFKAAAGARGDRMTDVLLEHIREYLKKYGVQPTKGRRR